MKLFDFKFKGDTVYMQAIRFIGALAVGIFLADIVFSIKYTGQANWPGSVTGLVLGAVFTILPGNVKKFTLSFDENGIHLYNLPPYAKQTKDIDWELLESVQMNKNKIILNYKSGSADKIKLPYYTKKRYKELNSYLLEAASSKGLKTS